MMRVMMIMRGMRIRMVVITILKMIIDDPCYSNPTISFVSWILVKVIVLTQLQG